MGSLEEKIDAACEGLSGVTSVSVCRCTANTIKDAMTFIENHWRAGHIMAHDLELVDFMHLSYDGKYNFIAATEGGETCGVLGYIPTSMYDLSLTEERDLWLAIWKNIGDAGSGLRMLKLAVRNFNTVAAIGINEKVARLYRFLGFDVFSLSQYYIANGAIDSFKIAKDPLRNLSGDLTSSIEIVPVQEDELDGLSVQASWRPRKTVRYLINRYLHHPIYKYQVWSARSSASKQVQALFVTRLVNVQGASCLRIVDAIGDVASLGSLAAEWLRIVREIGSEYVDVLTAGLSDDVWRRMGFEKLTSRGRTVIPNYFEPFIQSNVVIKAALWNPTGDPYVIFKGDSDQDRPSVR